MSVETEQELEGLRAAGRVVAEALREMRKHVHPGVTTAELDEVGARVFRRAGARSGPQLDYGFPRVNCISVNDEAVHGIPGRRRLRDGDLVKLDVTAELDGFYADACISVPVGRPAAKTVALARSARLALTEAIRIARAGTPLNALGLCYRRGCREAAGPRPSSCAAGSRAAIRAMTGVGTAGLIAPAPVGTAPAAELQARR
jgi:methionyl aminopeptidase